MKAFSDPEDLVEAVDEAKSHVIGPVIFWKERWEKFDPPKNIAWNWVSVPFESSSAAKVPNDKHGLYTFLLCPRVAVHPRNHLILYVGKAQRTTLRQRFHHYLQEVKKVKRAHISYALTKYQGHIEFCFTTIPHNAKIPGGEDALLIALMPPFNENFPASVSQIISGLR
jgi:hypothetical protein